MTMRLSRPTLLALCFATACGAAVFDACAQYASDWAPTKLEAIQLPRFCWAQMKVADVQGPEFYIRDCGPYANHYCFALTYFLRAKNWTGKGKPTNWLLRADGDVAYTEVGIKDYPQCSIRDHVAATRIELNQIMRMYGIKPPQRR
jgi:hypothetical protein